MSGAAANKMQSFVRTVNKDNYESFIDEQPDKNKILIFTDRKSTAPLYKSLSKMYKEKLVFGEVKKSAQELFDKFGVKETPALLALTDPLNYQGEAYENIKEANIDQLKKFLSNYAYADNKKEKKLELNHLKLKNS